MRAIVLCFTIKASIRVIFYSLLQLVILGPVKITRICRISYACGTQQPQPAKIYTVELSIYRNIEQKYIT